MMVAPPTAVFVYGTLKRGEEREGCWPRKPRMVERAMVKGALFDLGAYPALVEGSDVVAGGVWQFAGQGFGATLAGPDEVEGYSGGNDDLYWRVVIDCEIAGRTVRAWTYQYSRQEELGDELRMKPNADGICQWSRRSRPSDS